MGGERERARERELAVLLNDFLLKMQVLERARSLRAVGTATATKEGLDASKHLEHITEEQLDTCVTGSSVEAISSFLSSAQVGFLLLYPSVSMFTVGCWRGREREEQQQQQRWPGCAYATFRFTYCRRREGIT